MFVRLALSDDVSDSSRCLIFHTFGAAGIVLLLISETFKANSQTNCTSAKGRHNPDQ